MKLSSEVLIYLQSVKNYFKTDEEAKEYFIGKGDESLFYQHLCEIAEKNFNTNGEPTLNQMQFELLKKTTLVLLISKDNVEKKTTNVFVDYPNFNSICLN